MDDAVRELNEFRAHCFAGYKLAVGEGALVELQLRMFCEAVGDGLEAFAYEKLYEVESAIVQWFGDAISEEEAKALTRCRQLRNKIVHGDLHAVRAGLHGFGVEPARGVTVTIDVKGLSGAEMLAKLTSGEGRIAVADVTSTKQVGVWIWLTELATAGYLKEAVAVFQRVNGMVEELLNRAHRIARERRAKARG